MPRDVDESPLIILRNESDLMNIHSLEDYSNEIAKSFGFLMKQDKSNEKTLMSPKNHKISFKLLQLPVNQK